MKNYLILSSLLLCLNAFAVSSVEEIKERNRTQSCDSTCSVLGAGGSTTSKTMQRVTSCPSGFTGSQVEAAVLDADGKPTGAWKVIDKSACTCSATYENINGTCPAGQKGELVNRRDWTCSDSKTGSWGSPYNVKNTCYTPCSPLPAETRTQACPSGYTGSGRIQTRTSTCQSDDKLAPVWSAWTTTQDNCTYVPPPPPACTPQFTGTFGPPEICGDVIVQWRQVSYSSFYKCEYSGVWLDCEPVYQRSCSMTPIYTTC